MNLQCCKPAGNIFASRVAADVECVTMSRYGNCMHDRLQLKVRWLSITTPSDFSSDVGTRFSPATATDDNEEEADDCADVPMNNLVVNLQCVEFVEFCMQV